MIPPAMAATPSSTTPGSVSCSSSFPEPNSTPYTSTQPATQSTRLARPSADGRTSGARAATGPQPAREGRVRPPPPARVDGAGHGRGNPRGQRRGHARRRHVVRRACVAPHEATIKVVHEIAGSPVEPGGNRGHEGGRERGDHEPTER